MAHGSVLRNGVPLSSKPKAVIFDYGRTLYDREGERFFLEAREVLEYLRPKYRLAIVSIANEGDPPEARLKALEEAGIRQHFSMILFHRSEEHTSELQSPILISRMPSSA